MKINFGVKAELTAWFVLVMSAALVVLGFISWAYMSNRIYGNLSDAIDIRADEIIQRYKAGETLDKLQRFSSDEIVLILQPDVLMQRPYPSGFRGTQTGQTTIGKIARQFDIDQELERPEQQMQLSTYYTREGISPVLAVARSSAMAAGFIEDYRRLLMIVIPIALIAFTGGAYFLAWTSLSPLSRLTRLAEEIQDKDLSRRITVKKLDEVGRLAETFNKMLERLDVAFKRERRFMADAAHELRTPLAVIQSEATGSLEREKSPQEVRESMVLISRETTYMSEIMRNLLLLARTEASDGSREKFVPIDLKALLTEIGEDMLALCQDRGLDFVLDAPKSLSVCGDELMLKRLFMNIFDNAVRYNRDDGKVEVSLRNGTPQAVVRISDTGLGIADADLPHVFERFYRGIKVSPGAEIEGTGLGMAIAQTIAELHGGQITVTSKVGLGSVFTVRLPIEE